MRVSSFRVLLAHLILIVGVNCLISDDPVLPVTLNVVIWTVDLPKLTPQNLAAELENILPRYSPSIETGKPVHDIQLLLNYEANLAPASFLQHYEAFILKQPVDSDGYYVALVDDVAIFLHQIMEDKSFTSSYPVDDVFTLPMIILHSKFLPKHMIVSSMQQKEQCTLSVLSSLAFIDLSAKACDLSESINHNADQVRWAAPIVSSPYPFTNVLSEKSVYSPPEEVYTSHLTARVAGLVTSLVQAMSIGNLKWTPVHTTDIIYCPIVVLRNGGTEGARQHPNIPAIKKWLSSILLPNQEVILVSSDHWIDEHPQLSVAVASSHMIYSTTVHGDEIPGEHSERIPFIDSDYLFHELSSVGDSLCHLLLHQTGHGETLRSLSQAGEIKNLTISPSIKSINKNSKAKEKQWKEAAIVPVFVISDLHIHHDRLLSPNKDNKKKKNQHFLSARSDVPVQPLLNKDSTIAMNTDSSSVLILHSSEEIVSTFSSHAGTWKESNLSDLDSLIAEGLTRALTGFNAPHTQLETSDIIDLTWTHGIHPFSPFGRLSESPEKLHSIFSTSIQRGILIVRAHRVMQRAITVGHRSLALEGEITDTIRYLHSLHGSTRQAGRSFAGVNSRSVTDNYLLGEQMLDMNKAFPEMMIYYLRSVADHSIRLTTQLDHLRIAFKNTDPGRIVGVFISLESSLDEVEAYIESVEIIVHLQLKNCHIAFDVDPHLVEQISDRKLSQSAYDRMSMSPHARRKDHNAFNAGQFNMLFIAFAFFMILIIALALLALHIRMTKQAKKRM